MNYSNGSDRLFYANKLPNVHQKKTQHPSEQYMSAFEKNILNILDAINTNLLDIAVMLALQHPDSDIRKSAEMHKRVAQPTCQRHPEPSIKPQRGEDEN